MRTFSDVTLYNKYIDPTTRSEKYQRTQVQKVAFEFRKGSVVLRGGGYIEVDKATLYIPMARGANYLAPAAWLTLTDKTGKWTLQPADFAVKGLVTDEIAAAYTDPVTHLPVAAVTMTTLGKKYDNLFTIGAVKTQDQGSVNLRHWEVELG